MHTTRIKLEQSTYFNNLMIKTNAQVQPQIVLIEVGNKIYESMGVKLFRSFIHESQLTLFGKTKHPTSQTVTTQQNIKP